MFISLFEKSMSTSAILISSAASLTMGYVVARTYMYKNSYSKGFVSTLILLPFLVQVVIMMVNGNLGTSVAILGAFGLIRFRSVAGSARDISNIFLSMALGLASGMGHVTFALFVLVVTCITNLVIFGTSFGEKGLIEKELRIVIPESLDYEGIFDDILDEYTRDYSLVRVKTTNMGSLFELRYIITVDTLQSTKALIDALRVRNGNLNIVCGQVSVERGEL